MKQYLIPEQILSSIVNYLAKRPYEEVSEVIPILQRLPEGVPVPPIEQDEGDSQ